MSFALINILTLWLLRHLNTRVFSVYLPSRDTHYLTNVYHRACPRGSFTRKPQVLFNLSIIYIWLMLFALTVTLAILSQGTKPRPRRATSNTACNACTAYGVTRTAACTAHRRRQRVGEGWGRSVAAIIEQ